ncbi:MAG: hypothetical protein ACQGVK_08285 [Myxococcota bacterium]
MTLSDLFEAVQRVTDDDREAVALVTHLLSTGRVKRFLEEGLDTSSH